MFVFSLKLCGKVKQLGAVGNHQINIVARVNIEQLLSQSFSVL